jgi:hypothetical protein
MNRKDTDSTDLTQAARCANMKCLDTDFSWISLDVLGFTFKQPSGNCLYTLPRNGPNSLGLCFYLEVYLPQARFAHVRLGRTRTRLRPQWVAWDTKTNKSQSISLHRSQGNMRTRWFNDYPLEIIPTPRSRIAATCYTIACNMKRLSLRLCTNPFPRFHSGFMLLWVLSGTVNFFKPGLLLHLAGHLVIVTIRHFGKQSLQNPFLWNYISTWHQLWTIPRHLQATHYDF